MEVLDVSDPSSPTLKMTIPFPGSASDMDIHFNRGLAYVANRDGGLFILGFSHIPNLHNLRDHILGKEEIEEETHPYQDANKDFGPDISEYHNHHAQWRTHLQSLFNRTTSMQSLVYWRFGVLDQVFRLD